MTDFSENKEDWYLIFICFDHKCIRLKVNKDRPVEPLGEFYQEMIYMAAKSLETEMKSINLYVIKDDKITAFFNELHFQ